MDGPSANFCFILFNLAKYLCFYWKILPKICLFHHWIFILNLLIFSSKSSPSLSKPRRGKPWNFLWSILASKKRNGLLSLWAVTDPFVQRSSGQWSEYVLGRSDSDAVANFSFQVVFSNALSKHSMTLLSLVRELDQVILDPKNSRSSQSSMSPHCWSSPYIYFTKFLIFMYNLVKFTNQ